MEHSHNNMVTGESNTTEYIKFAVVILLILALSYGFFKLGDQQTAVEFMRWFMGVFMATFTTFKFIGYKMFAEMFAGYDVIAKRFSIYGKLFPFIELFLGSLYLFNLLPSWRNVLVIAVTGVASVGVFQEVYSRKSGVHCACLGNVIKLPLSTVSFIEDAGMFVMAAAMLLLT